MALRQVIGWLLKRHPKLNKHTVTRRCPPDWHIASQGRELFRAWQVPVPRYRYRYRGNRIPIPWGMPTG